ncbi:MAG: L-glutamate gamma-semialdehyde dehydrogenase [Thermoplasmata archaeon]|nr:L-glutamate gamma-semialdehyde dehydrogenase [Thermoplasmata archaeon]
MKTKIPYPENEHILSFSKGSEEREKVKEEMEKILNSYEEIPLIIGGKEIKSDETGNCILPHDKNRSIGKYYKAGKEEADLAIEKALEAREKWSYMPWEHRLSIFLKAAELLSKKYRYMVDAAVMLVHSKNAYQAEIDVAELIDFLRFNPYYAQEIYEDQPFSPSGTLNRMEYRPLEGFVFAIPPFNFLSIDGNLPSAPAMMGNVVIWKPPSQVVYSNYLLYKIFKEAGLPDGVINFLPGDSSKMGDYILKNPNLAGLHFTGSTITLQHLFRVIGENIQNYKVYPRIVGESGGKDFVFVHNSADIKETEVALLRGAFEYQGQKCSAASRAYVPKSLWDKIYSEIEKDLKTIKIGSPTDYSNFMNAVIDSSSFKKISYYIDLAKKSENAKILYGGKCDDSVGYFIEPTIIQVKDPQFITMRDEIFGPVLSLYVYDDDKYEETLDICNKTSIYALTGSIFARDRDAIITAEKKLRDAAGNFYINDKPTGAVVNQQPFGGARASGTNDKAGSKWNLIRWVTPRAIKENFNPPIDYKYPFLA